jgi:hypothetical protein
MAAIMTVQAPTKKAPSDTVGDIGMIMSPMSTMVAADHTTWIQAAAATTSRVTYVRTVARSRCSRAVADGTDSEGLPLSIAGNVARRPLRALESP